MQTADTSRARRQDFEWQCVVGAIDTAASDYANEGSIFGLPMSQTFVYGTVRDAAGVMWTPMRRLAAGDGGREKLLLQTDLDSDAIHIHRAGRASAYGLGVQRKLDGETLRLESDPAAEGAPFSISADAGSFRWVE